MAVSNFNDDLNIIAGLGNNPNSDNNLSDEQLKSTFDKSGLLIQKFLNEILIPAVNRIENAVGFKGTHKELTGRDAESQHPMSAITGLVEALEKASKSASDAMGVAVEKTSVVTETVTLLASGWVNNENSIQVRIIEDNPTAIFVSPEPTAENYAEYTECGVRCIENLGDGLKFACDAEPSISLTIHVVAFV